MAGRSARRSPSWRSPRGIKRIVWNGAAVVLVALFNGVVSTWNRTTHLSHLLCCLLEELSGRRKLLEKQPGLRRATVDLSSGSQLPHVSAETAAISVTGRAVRHGRMCGPATAKTSYCCSRKVQDSRKREHKKDMRWIRFLVNIKTDERSIEIRMRFSWSFESDDSFCLTRPYR